MSSESKYSQFGSKRPPHEKRTIKIQGAKEDDGKWYRCWHCGFINNVDRNAVGDGEGLSYSVATLPNSDSTIGLGGTIVLLNQNPVFTERHNISPDAVSGCSFCGCKNYR